MSGFRFFVAAFLLSSLACWAATADEPRDSKLLRSLRGRSESVRLHALASASTDPATKRKALGDLIVAAKRAAEETAADELLRPSSAALLYLIGTIDDPDAESLLIEMLDSPHAGIAMISADALGQNKFYGSIEFLKKQVSRAEYGKQYGFRFNLIRALAQMHHPDAVEFLGELRESMDGQLRFQVDKLLDDVTASDFQGDEERYEKWKGAAKRESIFKPSAYESESLHRIKLSRQQYYGIDIHAKRLMFIIDNSGSMKDYWGGLTRLDRAKNELIRAITELPENSEFAIVFYHTTISEWRNDLVPATEENKREAIQFVRRLGYGNKTNTYGALRRSLEFSDDLESVFLLTDGRPTVGDIISPDAIVADILHRNRFRHLNFNAVGIAVQGPTEAFLRKLTEESNGEFRVAN